MGVDASNNPLVVTPAYTGLINNLTVFSTYRNQWSGIPGSPTTFNAGGHISLRQNKLGAGIMFVKDRIGENVTTQFSGSFAYKLKINEGTILSFGMQGGFVNYKMDPSQLNIKDSNVPRISPGWLTTENQGCPGRHGAFGSNIRVLRANKPPNSVVKRRK